MVDVDCQVGCNKGFKTKAAWSCARRCWYLQRIGEAAVTVSKTARSFARRCCNFWRGVAAVTVSKS